MIIDKGIPIKNIYYMLSYAFTSLNKFYDDEIAGEQFDNIHNLFAAIMVKGIGHQLKQGLYREYVDMSEDTTSIHGKIDMKGTMRNRAMHTNRAVCQYDDFSKNNIYNQVIKTTAKLLLISSEVKTEYKDGLRRELTFFADIGDANPSIIDWSVFKFHRNNQTYKMLLGISQMVLEGMILTTDSGEIRLAKFVDEQRMCRLYEKFILEYYRKEVPMVRAESSQIEWAVDGESDSLLPVMQSDIMLSYEDKVLIIDAKYYAHTLQTHFDTQTIHSGNLFQILAYVQNKQKDPGIVNHKVAGMLLYARTEDLLQPDVSTKILGNEIFVRTLDLNQEFTSIAEQLSGIAKGYFELVGTK